MHAQLFTLCPLSCVASGRGDNELFLIAERGLDVTKRPIAFKLRCSFRGVCYFVTIRFHDKNIARRSVSVPISMGAFNARIKAQLVHPHYAKSRDRLTFLI